MSRLDNALKEVQKEKLKLFKPEPPKDNEVFDIVNNKELDLFREDKVNETQFNLESIVDYIKSDKVEVHGNMPTSGMFNTSIDELPENMKLHILLNQTSHITGENVKDIMREESPLLDSYFKKKEQGVDTSGINLADIFDEDKYIEITKGMELEQINYEKNIDQWFKDNYDYHEFVNLVKDNEDLREWYPFFNAFSDHRMGYENPIKEKNEEGNYEIVGSEWIPSEGDVSPEVIDSIVHSYKKWQGSYIGGYDAVRSLGIFDPNEWQNNKSGVE